MYSADTFSAAYLATQEFLALLYMLQEDVIDEFLSDPLPDPAEDPEGWLYRVRHRELRAVYFHARM